MGARGEPTSAQALAERIDALLPQMHCQRCGYPACGPYAQAIADGAPVDLCPPGGPGTIEALATLTGRPVPAYEPASGIPEALQLATIDEAHCIGCALCLKACPVDAIVGAPRRMHAIIAAWCTGCGLCLPPCPVDCIRMRPAGREWSIEDAQGSRLRYATHAARRAGVPAASAAPGTSVHSTESKAAAVERALARARARRHAVHVPEKP